MPPGRPFRRDLPISKDEHRINDRIRVPRVKVVDENGVMLGEMPTEQARQIALGRRGVADRLPSEQKTS